MLAPLAAALTLLAPADSVLLRVMVTGDFHGALEARVYGWSRGRPVGGLAALAATMDSAGGACRCPVLRLDAGDQMQGTLASNLVHGRSVVEAFNLLRLDAAVVGNHDLDWGVDTLRARMAEARYPWIAANLVDSVTGRRPAWLAGVTTITKGTWRIGIVGYANPATKRMVMAGRVAGLDVRGGRAALEPGIRELRRSGVDLVIVLAHEGAHCDAAGCRGEIVELARELDPAGVDLIAAGHTHGVVATTVNGIPILAARANGTALGIADLVAGAGGARRWHIRVIDVHADRVAPDSMALALVERYRPAAERVGQAVVVTVADSFLTGAPQFPLGNLIADAERAVASADVALMNNGGIRRGLLPGPVSYGDLFELHPFGNIIVTVPVTGAELATIIEHTIARGHPRYHVSGLEVRYDPARPAGRRVVALHLAAGTALHPRRTYTLAIPDFLARGGDGLPVVSSRLARSTDATDLEATAALLRKLPAPIRAVHERRYIAVRP